MWRSRLIGAYPSQSTSPLNHTMLSGYRSRAARAVLQLLQLVHVRTSKWLAIAVIGRSPKTLRIRYDRGITAGGSRRAVGDVV
jgi:hypothetical protein